MPNPPPKPPPDPPEFRWNPNARRFVNRANRFVPRSAVRSAIDAMAEALADRLEQLARDLIAEKLELGEWQKKVAEEIKAGHVAAAAVAIGGKDRLGPRELGRVGARIKSEYAYLNDFAREIDRDGIASEGQFVTRARMYGNATVGTFENAQRVLIGADYSEERRVVNSSIPCRECSDYAARGWVAAGSLPGIGNECSCKSNCRCFFQTRNRHAPAAP